MLGCWNLTQKTVWICMQYLKSDASASIHNLASSNFRCCSKMATDESMRNWLHVFRQFARIFYIDFLQSSLVIAEFFSAGFHLCHAVLSIKLEPTLFYAVLKHLSLDKVVLWTNKRIWCHSWEDISRNHENPRNKLPGCECFRLAPHPSRSSCRNHGWQVECNLRWASAKEGFS